GRRQRRPSARFRAVRTIRSRPRRPTLTRQEVPMTDTTKPDVQIDPRGYRFGAGVTLVIAVLALVLGAGSAGLVVMALLVLLFAPGAFIGPQATLQSALFKGMIRPRLSPPTETESFRPPRFAQQMGFAMAVAALVLGLLGLAWGFYV